VTLEPPPILIGACILEGLPILDALSSMWGQITCIPG
jgi:hypothetical protein